MKKLSTLIAIILIATIGGVYASWNYANSSTGFGIHDEKAILLTEAVQEGAAGAYTLTHNIDTISIEPETQENKKAEMVATYTAGASTPSITLTFTPKSNASKEIKTNGVKSYVYFGMAQDLQWQGNSVFGFTYGKTSPITIDIMGSGAQYAWEDEDEDGVFTCTINFTEIEDIVELATDVYLPSIEDYNSFFQTVFGGNNKIQLHLHISNEMPQA